MDPPPYAREQSNDPACQVAVESDQEMERIPYSPHPCVSSCQPAQASPLLGGWQQSRSCLRFATQTRARSALGDRKTLSRPSRCGGSTTFEFVPATGAALDGNCTSIAHDLRSSSRRQRQGWSVKVIQRSDVRVQC